MKLTYSFLPALTLGATLPDISTRDTGITEYVPLTFTFHGGPATYTLDMRADGNYYPTNNGLAVNLIDTSTFDAWGNCNFLTNDKKSVSGSRLGATIEIGPPQAIISVQCKPTPTPPSTCLPVYASCKWCGGGYGGCYVLGCCSGYCAATKCRPTS